ncbi:NAD(P)/FAD-dependent oxidoreductase [Microbacterium aoyamense]|uniref:NAD(P)/FAD-dependent oxidoreductase n=1 Tax=Microbacterium aoyamense TaxID=344166 RepID=A0ABN2PYA7_9MICO|nr:NAD(P)-binding domain-containing protein [Microbacterium aoyamense]
MTVGLSHRRAIIVGAGQSGLAVAAALIAEGLRPQQDFVVVDAADTQQRSWSTRWHSMSLLSDARHSALPNHPHSGDQRRAIRADEMADYLADVESTLGVETQWGVSARNVERHGSGPTLFLATNLGDVQTRNIVCATGAAARAHMPEWAIKLVVPGSAMHSSQYQYPRQIAEGDVLIVGGGNSGVQLARELSASHAVTLSVRGPRRHRAVERHSAYTDSRGRWWRRPQAEPIFGESLSQLRRAGVNLVPDVVDAHGAEVVYADGSRSAPHSIIYATGFTPANRWLPPRRGQRPLRATLTDLPGLFVAGDPAHGSPASGTIAGVGRDATAIAHHIVNRP